MPTGSIVEVGAVAADPGSVSVDGLSRLSLSNLWQAQRRFYEDEGIQAWDGRIPCHATSNPLIANAYAQLIVRFLQDRAREAGRLPEPAVILELGSGAGVFGFYVVKRLLELRESLGMADLPFVYVMSDLSEKNVAFWRQHPALRGLVAQGVLDFARHDVGASRPLHLLESGLVLEAGAGRPLIVLANYVFDTLPQDVFRVEGGRLLEGLTRGMPEGTSLPTLDNVAVSLDQLGVSLQFREVSFPYYGNPWIDGILQRYAETLPDQGFLFPSHALLGLHELVEMAGGDLLLIATDKSYGDSPPRKVSAETPELAMHDASFSLMVDFHALGQYFAARGGGAFHQPAVQATTTSVFHLGAPFERLVEARQALSTFFLEISPADLHALFSQAQIVMPGSSPEVIAAFLSLARWDPALVNLHIDQLIQAAKTAGPEMRRLLAEGMRRCVDCFYYLPGAESTLANAGIVFQEMQDYATALAYYRKSLEWFGQEPPEIYANTVYNMGLCHYYRGEPDEALAAFREADRVALRKDMMAKGWIHHLTTEIQEGE
ncbi:MAG TPA: tetratricopeptide repeat protein [Thermoanaerobaculia bacterium]|nr:tetratricopeptide repeat protein [Thermoanaerobaculia bacterium]